MRRIFFYITFILLVFFVELFNWIGFLMDEVFFSSYKKSAVKSPLFIFGMPRSATTFLYNALNEDHERFTSMKLWEILFAPSITQKKIIVQFSKLDKMLNLSLSRRLKKWESIIFSPYEKLHPLSLFNIEEDDYILMHAFSSAILVFIFPGVKKYRSLGRFDSELSVKSKKKIMTFYKRCIQKHMYVFGNNRNYLSKSPSHTPRLKSLNDTFVDCKLIYLLRIPEQTISSAISIYHVYQITFYTSVKSEEVTREALNTADHWYSYPITTIERWNNNNSQIVKFEELISNPEKVITELYNNFGFEISEHFKEKIIDLTKHSTNYKSRHKHSLLQYGLRIEDIRARYFNVYKSYFPNVSANVIK